MPAPSKNASTFTCPMSVFPSGVNLILHVLLSVVVEWVVTLPFGRVARSLMVRPTDLRRQRAAHLMLSSFGTFTSGGQVIVRFGTGADTGSVVAMKLSRSSATPRFAESVRFVGVIRATPFVIGRGRSPRSVQERRGGRRSRLGRRHAHAE